MKRTLIAILLALAMVLIPVGSAFALSSEDVTITADPTWALSISITPNAWLINPAVKDTTYWWNTVAPTFPLDDGECASTILNDGTEPVDISITGHNFSLGKPNGWDLVDDTTPGQMEVMLRAWLSGAANEAAGVTLLNAAENTNFVVNLDDDVADAIKWEMRLITGNSFTNATEKVGLVTLLATQHM